MIEVATSGSPLDISEDAFLEFVADIRSAEPKLGPIGAAIIAALHLGICRDSRTFSRLFGISHALVLREISVLSDDENGLLRSVSRNERTQRTELALTPASERIAKRS